MYIRERWRDLYSDYGSRTMDVIQTGAVIQHLEGRTKTQHELFEDVVNNRGPFNSRYYHNNPARKRTDTKTGGFINGTAINSNTYRVVWNNWGNTWMSAQSLDHSAVANEPSDGWCASEVVSRTNPSKPSVNIPLSIIELKDIPRMLRKKLGARLKGGTAIEASFGYGPLIGDIIEMVKVVKSIDKRIATLNALGDGNLSRHRKLWSGSTINHIDGLFDIDYTSRASIRANKRVYTTRVSKYATAQWRPNFDISEFSDHEKWKYAMRIAFGLEPSNLLSTLYDALPWSWFVDWFTNLGDMVALTNNSAASMIGPPVVSTVRETTLKVSGFSLSPVAKGTFSCSPIVMTRRDWARNLVPVLAQFRLPILTIGQVSILQQIANSER